MVTGSFTRRGIPGRIANRCLIALLLAALAILAYNPVADIVFASRLILAVRAIAGGATGEDLSIIESTETRTTGSGEIQCLVYRPARALPTRALVMVPGISELGCRHPRLMAIARHLAASGFLVLTPDIRALREFRMDPAAIDQIAYWILKLPSVAGGANVRAAGLSGISFSAALAVIAAARPDLLGRVSYIFGIGAYDDPLRCSRVWFASGPVTVGPGYYPTRFYGKWILMLASLDLLEDAEERRFLKNVLTNLLLQKAVPPAPPDLGERGGRWYRLAVMREDESDPELAGEIEGRLKAGLYREISPERAAPEIRCPVFLVHGAHDDLIPPDESGQLARRLVNAPTHLLITPFLTHTHPVQKEPGRWDKLKGLLEIAGFFYAFADAAR